MKLTLLDQTAIALVCSVVGNVFAIADPSDPVKQLRLRVLEAKSPDDKAKAYQALFEHVRRAGLPQLMKDPDVGIALQAAWEANAKPTKRARHIDNRDDDIYDPASLRDFVQFLSERTNAPVPEWWAKCVTHVERGKIRHMFEAVINASELVPAVTLPEYKEIAGIYVPQEAGLARKGDRFVYSANEQWVKFNKDPFGKSRLDSVTGTLGQKWSAIAAYRSSGGGMPFHVAGFEGEGGEPSWTATVWAINRKSIFGYSGRNHWVELTENAGTIYVFGVEGFGMYVEGFEAVTGNCLFRFCSCYWWHWSEGWGPKWPQAPAISVAPPQVEIGPKPQERPSPRE
jgi:hypothetical protein